MKDVWFTNQEMVNSKLQEMFDKMPENDGLGMLINTMMAVCLRIDPHCGRLCKSLRK